MSTRSRILTFVGSYMLAACFALAAVPASSAEGDVQWRVSDQGDSALLVIADSEATDHFGSPLFDCRKGAGIATAEGDTTEDLRTTIAARILHDEEPAIDLMPGDTSAQSLDAVYSNLTGWRYRFLLSVSGPAFEQLARTGAFEFKLGDTVVRSEFKVGLENVRKFQDLCKRPPA